MMMMNCMKAPMPVSIGRRPARTVPMHISFDFSPCLGKDNGGGRGGLMRIGSVPAILGKPLKKLQKRPSTKIKVSLSAHNRLKKKVKKQEEEIRGLKKKFEELSVLLKQRQDMQVVLVDPTGKLAKVHLEVKNTPELLHNLLGGLGMEKKKEESKACDTERAEPAVNHEETAESVARNYIFKQNYLNGLSLDLEELKKCIKACFVNDICAKYDWFALWRILKDHDFLRDYKTSTFVRQMELWFGKEKLNGVAAAMNLYRSGYLGNYSYKEWGKDAFLKKMKGKQSEEGFNRLSALCKFIEGELVLGRFLIKKT